MSNVKRTNLNLGEGKQQKKMGCAGLGTLARNCRKMLGRPRTGCEVTQRGPTVGRECGAQRQKKKRTKSDKGGGDQTPGTLHQKKNTNLKETGIRGRSVGTGVLITEKQQKKWEGD